VILAVSIGLALERWAGVVDATLLGAAVGLLVAMLVPLKARSCSVR
jgi:hypothetical protein